MTNDTTSRRARRARTVRARPPVGRHRRAAVLGALLALVTLGAAPAAVLAHASRQAPVQVPVQAPVAEPATRAAVAVPWGVGERFGYDVKFGILHAGSATLEVPEIVDVRDRPAYHAVFHLQGGTFFYHVDDTYESWMDTASLSSVRFYQTQHEGGKTRIKRYEIFPDRATYQDANKPEEKSVADPLDDGSILYAVRMLPLRTGEVYELNRYYKPDRNPVRIHVLRREQVRVPAGTFNAIVVQPTVKTTGIFSEGGRAEVWLSDDDQRVILKVHSSLSFGSLTMQLTSRRSGKKPA